MQIAFSSFVGKMLLKSMYLWYKGIDVFNRIICENRKLRKEILESERLLRNER